MALTNFFGEKLSYLEIDILFKIFHYCYHCYPKMEPFKKVTKPYTEGDHIL